MIELIIGGILLLGTIVAVVLASFAIAAVAKWIFKKLTKGKSGILVGEEDVLTGVVDELRKINEPLAQCCVADCIYRNWCYEHKTCGYHLTNSFNAKVNEYREGINLWKSGEISKDMKESIK